ncbi:hypothetical protein MMC19_007065 [Ptychographa xylographoides]|nr:hypothetical protein [Ptychographa xylographoides]
MAWKDRAVESHGGFLGFIVHTVVRFFQFVLALTVIGLYGTDLNNARIAHVYADGKWVYAVVVAVLAAVTALVFMVPFFKTYKAFPWDFIVCFLWVVVFGIFGNLYIRENAEGDAGIQRMKNAVWVDLANMLLWLISALFGLFMFFKFRGGKSLHTGRATV